MKKEIYTLGSSTRTWEEFLEILKDYKIKTLVDVRRFPTSKIAPHFKKEALSSELSIKYIWLGEELGGYRKGGYEKFMKTEEFRQGFRQLENIALAGKTILLCAERLPWKCHRFYISHQLEKRGFKVAHIIEKDKLWDSQKEKREIKPTCQQKLKI